MRARGNGREHVFLAVNQSRRVVAGGLKTVAVRNGVGGTSLHAVAAEDAARIIDVVNLGVALAAADAQSVGVFRGFDVDAIGRAGGGAEEARHALFEAIFIALQHMRAAIALLEFGRRVRVVLGDGGIHHLAQGDRHALGDGGGGLEDVGNFGHWKFYYRRSYFSGSRPGPSSLTLNPLSIRARDRRRRMATLRRGYRSLQNRAWRIR